MTDHHTTVQHPRFNIACFDIDTLTVSCVFAQEQGMPRPRTAVRHPESNVAAFAVVEKVRSLEIPPQLSQGHSVH